MYKLKQFWIYRYSWSWCFAAWQALMFPWVVYSTSVLNDPDLEEDSRNLFWLYLNNFHLHEGVTSQ